MQLDHRSIVRDDFPRVRRGYDPDEVRRHLKQIAELVEELQQDRLMAPVAESAALQVRSIVQAAERSGAQLESAAKEEAERIRAEAERVREEAEAEAEDARTQATAEAAERVEQVHEASRRVLERAEAIEQELAALHGETAALSGTVLPEQDEEPPDAEPHEPGDDVEPEEEGPEADAAKTAAGPDPDEHGTDVEDIRLIALNMALNGSSRTETGSYLRENFEIEDPEALLDGVYSQARP